MGAFDDLIPQGGTFDDLIPQSQPNIGQPEELAWYEKLASQAPDWMSGNVRGSWVGRLAKGAADPGAAVVQMAANVLPDSTGIPQAVNQRIAERETEYQDARKQAGSEGFDPLRVVGQAAITAPLIPAGAGVVRGALLGGAAGAVDPVRDGGESFWADKAKQAAFGAATGAVVSPLMGALSRIVSPKASVNPDMKLLRSEGVQPTVGQSLGGWANRLEEKAQSVPIMGDAITAARQRSIEQFNKAALNRAGAPIGVKVAKAGQEAVEEVGDALSNAYRQALGKVNHVNLDTPTFNAQFGQLQEMSKGLSGPMRRKFENTVNNVVLRKMSPNGSILGADLKAVDSELGKIASRYKGSSAASEQELGDAVLQLKSILTQEVRTAFPEVNKALSAADKGWANLVRVEGASKAAINREGIFTPGQLNQAIRTADKSVRKRATARGDALMQDLGMAGQNVLGNKYPDSGTPGRVMAGILGVGAGAINPAIPAGLIAGAGAYAPPVQNLLRYLLTQRPESAPIVANYLRQLTAPASVAAVPLAQEMN